MARLFSQRHRDAILEGNLIVSFQQRVNRRVWQVLERFNESYRVDDGSGWFEERSFLDDTARRIREAHGWERLGVKRGKGAREPTDLKGFVAETYPSEVLDAVEAFYLEMPNGRGAFAAAINEVFEDEGAPWRLSDGQFFKVDSEFLRQNVLARSQELLVAEGFQGAFEEFVEARNDLESGDHKGAIHNACKAYESALKAVLGTVTGNANKLLERFEAEGFLDDLPEEIRGGVLSQVMLSVPFLRNRLGGHGQGEAVVEVEKQHAELALHLAGSLIVFVVEAHLKRKPEEPDRESSSVPSDDDDDLPF